MSRIPKNLREQVARRAKYRCEYCLVPERFLATIFHIDHIRSLKHGGPTTSERAYLSQDNGSRSNHKDFGY